MLHLVWPLAQSLSSTVVPTRSRNSSWHSLWDLQGTQAPQLRQSNNTLGGLRISLRRLCFIQYSDIKPQHQLSHRRRLQTNSMIAIWQYDPGCFCNNESTRFRPSTLRFTRYIFLLYILLKVLKYMSKQRERECVFIFPTVKSLTQISDTPMVKMLIVQVKLHCECVCTAF